MGLAADELNGGERPGVGQSIPALRPCHLRPLTLNLQRVPGGVSGSLLMTGLAGLVLPSSVSFTISWTRYSTNGSTIGFLLCSLVVWLCWLKWRKSKEPDQLEEREEEEQNAGHTLPYQ